MANEPTVPKSNLMYAVKTPDFSNMNLAGVAREGQTVDEDDERITGAYQEAMKQRKALADALEQRYAQPNLYNVAAGFLKPQLGGFGASLGSASQAMGENVEQQRAIAPTIAQMRAEIAAQEVPLNQRYKANKLLDNAVKKPGGMTSEDVATIANYDAGLGKIAQEKFQNQTSTLNNMLNAIKAGESKTELYSKFPKDFVDLHYESLVKMVPGRDKSSSNVPGTGNGKPPGAGAAVVGGSNNVPAGTKPAAPSGNANVAPQPSPFSRETPNPELARQVAGASAGTNEKQDWANPNYTVAPPPMQPNDTQVSYLERMNQNRDQTRKDLAELSYVPKDQNFVARRENLVKMADLLGDRDVREFAKRGSQNELASIVAAALSSDTPPDAVANMVRKSNFITPMDSDAKVKKFQEYIQALAREQAVVNNLIKNPTNQKFGMETAASIQQGTQPAAAFRLIMEELHKMQRQSVMPGLMQPYADAGYGMADALNSQRVRDYERDWNRVHSKFGEKSGNYKLPSFLTAPDAYSTGFNFRTHLRGQ